MSDPDSPLTHDQPLLPPPSSSSNPNDAPNSVADLPIASTPANSKSSRRLPPPCWSLEETIALIDAYRDKWHALNRGNLKANHWEEVAEAVAVNCPDATPKKTAVQCRHKMEKLRKRYRTEIQRARSVPVARFISSWVHYKRMEAMENRPEEENNEEGGGGSSARTTPRFFNRNGSGGGGGGIRIRIPTGVSIAQPGPRLIGKIDQKYTTASQSSGVGVNQRPGRLGGGKRGREEENDDPMVEIASAIKLLGDTLVRTEERKMEMTREIEAMWRDMEMKRTKMILESQQRLVEGFAKTLSENTTEEMKQKKKARRVSSSSLATDS